MKISSLYFILLLGAALTLPGCTRPSGTVWEDTKTAVRRVYRKGQSFWGQDTDSRMIETAADFKGPIEEEYIPLEYDNINQSKQDISMPQPQEDLPLPKIGSVMDYFKVPPSSLVDLFQNIYFEVDQHIIKDKKFFHVIDKIAAYMKDNPDLYVFAAGHCDERADEQYNLALGTRRAHFVRNLLIKKGVHANRIYTISFGKEMPVDLGHNEIAWKKNRRVEFKIFDKSAQGELQ